MLIARISRDETHIDAIGGPSEIMTESVIVLSSIYQSFKAYDPQLADHYRKTLRDMVQNDNHIMWNPPSSVMEGVTVAIPRRRNG